MLPPRFRAILERERKNKAYLWGLLIPCVSMRTTNYRLEPEALADTKKKSASASGSTGKCPSADRLNGVSP